MASCYVAAGHGCAGCLFTRSFNTCSHVLNDGVGLHFITFHMFDSDATIFYCCKMDETGVFSIVMTANSRWG